jgi:hypothetical protein
VRRDGRRRRVINHFVGAAEKPSLHVIIGPPTNATTDTMESRESTGKLRLNDPNQRRLPVDAYPPPPSMWLGSDGMLGRP